MVVVGPGVVVEVVAGTDVVVVVAGTAVVETAGVVVVVVTAMVVVVVDPASPPHAAARRAITAKRVGMTLLMTVRRSPNPFRVTESLGSFPNWLEPRRQVGRLNPMKALTLSVVIAVALSACGVAGPAGPDPDDVDTARLMALALTELVTEDHTFGDGPPPFTEYLIETKTAPIELESGPSSESSRPLTEDERAAIESAISEFGPVRWIDDPDEWRTEDLTAEIEGSVILGVDAPIFDDEGALVPVSLWCGGLCGTWFTYRLVQEDGVWEVSGIEGMMTIS